MQQRRQGACLSAGPHRLELTDANLTVWWRMGGAAGESRGRALPRGRRVQGEVVVQL